MESAFSYFYTKEMNKEQWERNSLLKVSKSIKKRDF